MKLLIALFCLFSTSSTYAIADEFNSKAKGVTLENIAKVQAIHDSAQQWAFRGPNGEVATNDQGDQGDMMERAGFLCMFGVTEHCDDVKNAQGEDGRIWRAHQYINVSTINTFSRDHLNGYFAYLITTKDVESAKHFYSYLEKNKYKMCPKASDNRCILMPDSWGMMKEVWQYIGLKPTLKMKLGSLVDDTAAIVTAPFHKKGFEAVLPAWTVLLRRQMNKMSLKMEATACISLERQPHNAFVRFAAEGISNAMADSIIAGCPLSPGKGPYDFIWNREIHKMDGKLYTGNPREDELRLAYDAADGWDCLLVSTMFLNEVKKLGLK